VGNSSEGLFCQAGAGFGGSLSLQPGLLLITRILEGFGFLRTGAAAMYGRDRSEEISTFDVYLHFLVRKQYAGIIRNASVDPGRSDSWGFWSVTAALPFDFPGESAGAAVERRIGLWGVPETRGLSTRLVVSGQRWG